MTENKAKCKSIFEPKVARRLLKMGHRIVDIKPKKENPDASIFLFEDTEKFWTDLAMIKSSDETGEA